MAVSGEGPSRELQRTGHWEHEVVAVSEGPEPNKVVRVRMGDPSRDPGYWSTSRMLLEAALCLALQASALFSGSFRILAFHSARWYFDTHAL